MNVLRLEDLVDGNWYIPVFKKMEPTDIWGNALDIYRVDSPLFKYLGNGKFETEYEESVDSFYDSELSLMVAVDATDGFIT